MSPVGKFGVFTGVEFGYDPGCHETRPVCPASAGFLSSGRTLPDVDLP